MVEMFMIGKFGVKKSGLKSLGLEISYVVEMSGAEKSGVEARV